MQASKGVYMCVMLVQEEAYDQGQTAAYCMGSEAGFKAKCCALGA